jgi:hypothetical protein
MKTTKKMNEKNANILLIIIILINRLGLILSSLLKNMFHAYIISYHIMYYHHHIKLKQNQINMN